MAAGVEDILLRSVVEEDKEKDEAVLEAVAACWREDG